MIPTPRSFRPYTARPARASFSSDPPRFLSASAAYTSTHDGAPPGLLHLPRRRTVVIHGRRIAGAIREARGRAPRHAATGRNHAKSRTDDLRALGRAGVHAHGESQAADDLRLLRLSGLHL